MASLNGLQGPLVSIVTTTGHFLTHLYPTPRPSLASCIVEPEERLLGPEKGCITVQPEETSSKPYLLQNQTTLSHTEHPCFGERLCPCSVFSICDPPLSSHCKHRVWRALRRLPKRHMNSALNQGRKLKGRRSMEFRLNG